MKGDIGRRIAVANKCKVSVEIVNDLDHDTGPVDGVYSTQIIGFAEILLAKQLLKNGLAVVKGSIHGNVMDILVGNGSHLGLLDRRYPSLWEHNEHRNALFPRSP